MKKTFFEKMVIFIELLAGICTITGVSIWGIATYINGEKDKSEYLVETLENREAVENIEKDSTEEGVEDVIENMSIDTEDYSVDINYSSNDYLQDEKNIELVNVEDEVKRIRKYYNDVQEQKGNSQQHPVDKDIRVYYISSQVVSIEVASGYNGINYSRIYYFDKDGKLSFAFIFDKRKENRLYVKNDTLIRYVDENGEIYDLHENLETCDWYELVRHESYELLKSVNL